ncbi:glucose 1-dehydrogenase [Sphingomonas sp. CFBP 13728]|uniref:SDR family NAD(P)-dependent oxidoreductase n=1 Tax=Sphingomonas sp. CFBP 13728 TaxID=2775294 RepID=UPI00178016C1|nr:glucose 1-dehydrogenase [Sphingomonas sp. CFBP 13728]MBD8621018.1 glucose 1-dehydrogenase [Sphingomonas sp. CFBP 13728]
MKLTGKVAIVTGASSGIGAGIAEAFGAEGAVVYVNYRNSKDGADAVVASIEKAGGKAFAAQADMSKSADVARLFDTVVADNGKIDVLVNNAGLAVFQMVTDLTEDAFHEQFNVNVLGYFLAIREAVKHFGEGGGSIVNIGSIVSTHPSVGGSVYSATKGAVDTMTYGLARELGPRGIRVNGIMPGYTNTPGTDGMFVGELRERLLAETPLGRVGEPEDIAPTAVFLASDDSHWISGESIRVTGGARGL